MVQIDLSSNVREVIPALDLLFGDQVPFACALALTRTAQDGQRAVYSEMDSQWDRPTPFSKRSLYVTPAKKTQLAAAVEIKDQFPAKSSATPDQTYRHQYEGGPRIRKGLERYLTQAGLISAREWMAPGDGAKLDAYGNVSRGQLAQIMSQLRLGLDPASWKTNSTRSKRHRKKSGEMFWSRGGTLARGIWMRDGRSAKPIMIVVSEPNYQARIQMPRVIRETIDAKFSDHLSAALELAVATKR